MAEQRLQKILAAAGIASRRAAEGLIVDGHVTVNGQRVTELGAKADPEKDHVKVDGKLVRLPKTHRYIVMNKPRGVIVTRDDPEERETVMSLLRGRVGERIVPVGRLDADSEGLLLLTNDGSLVYKLSHPSGGCRKEYEVKVSGVPTPEQIAKLERGVWLEEGVKTAPARIEITDTTPEKGGLGGNAWLRVTLGEGRSRQIRRMFELIGHPVGKLRRVAIGPLRDRKLKPGEFRDLLPEEVEALRSIRPGEPLDEMPRSGPPRPRKPRSAGHSGLAARETAPPAPLPSARGHSGLAARETAPPAPLPSARGRSAGAAPPRRPRSGSGPSRPPGEGASPRKDSGRRGPGRKSR